MPMQKDKREKGVDGGALLTRSGFTMLEILVALVLGSIFITAICTLIIDQTQTHQDHQMKVVMQQDGRAALSVLSNALMIAGYSPQQGDRAGIVRAGIDRVIFDYMKSGTAEKVEYCEVSNEDRLGQRLNDGDRRETLLRNVEAFRVLYAYDSDDLGAGADKYGVLEKDNSGNIYWGFDDTPDDADDMLTKYYTLDGSGRLATNNPTPDDLSAQPSVDRIRAAKIWLLMRSNKRKNNHLAETQVDFIPGVNVEDLDTENYSYRLYTTTVKLRNMYY